MQITRSSPIYVAFTVALVLGASLSAFAAVLNPVADFPASQGDSGYWAQYLIPSMGEFFNLPMQAHYAFVSTESPWGIPKVAKSGAAILMHPGLEPFNADQWAILTFKASVEDDYSFSVQFADADPNGFGCTTNAVVFKNDAFNAPLFEVRSVSKTESPVISGTVHLAPGEMLRFGIAPGAEGYNDTTRLSQVAMTPEPGSILALAMGLAGGGLAGLRGRRMGRAGDV